LHFNTFAVLCGGVDERLQGTLPYSPVRFGRKLEAWAVG
jgi:hypothetical protein